MWCQSVRHDPVTCTIGPNCLFRSVTRRARNSTVRVSQATETSGPIGAIIDVGREREAEGVIVVRLSGDLDVFSVPRLRSTLREHLGQRDVVLDLAGVAFCDSSTLRVFVEAQRASAAGGRTLELTNLSKPVRELFDVSGLSGVLRVT